MDCIFKAKRKGLARFGKSQVELGIFCRNIFYSYFFNCSLLRSKKFVLVYSKVGFIGLIFML